MSQTARTNYGAHLGRTFAAESAAVLTTQLRDETFAVTRLRRSIPNPNRTEPLPAEEAFHFGLQLVDRGNVELWTENRLAFKGYIRAGTLSMLDIALRPSSYADGPQDAILYYVPRSILDGLALENDAGPVTELVVPPGRSIVDPVVHHLSLALLPSLANPEHVSQLFFDQVALAFKEHVMHVYGRMRRPFRTTSGGLAPWQERRAKELIAANLGGDVPIADLARQCRLSRSHFVRAFKATTGLPPHRWLTLRRIASAKMMMRDTTIPLATIAAECGFAHASHFAKVFSTFVGTTPTDWRRHARGAKR